jgi:hypothetical protein
VQKARVCAEGAHRGAKGAEGLGCGEGVSPFPQKFLKFFLFKMVHFGGFCGVYIENFFGK